MEFNPEKLKRELMECIEDNDDENLEEKIKEVEAKLLEDLEKLKELWLKFQEDVSELSLAPIIAMALEGITDGFVIIDKALNAPSEEESLQDNLKLLKLKGAIIGAIMCVSKD